MKWKVLESTYLHKEPWFTVRKEKCELPTGKTHDAYYVLEYPTWVNGFALTESGKVLMVKQYRHGLGIESIELPGGVVDEGEEPQTAVERELLEETGYQFSRVQLLGKVSANPATSNNYTYMYLLQGGRKVADQSLDETEDVEVHLYTIDELKQLLADNGVMQALHISTCFYALQHLGLLK